MGIFVSYCRGRFYIVTGRKISFVALAKWLVVARKFGSLRNSTFRYCRSSLYFLLMPVIEFHIHPGVGHQYWHLWTLVTFWWNVSGVTCLSCRAFFRRAHQAANIAGDAGPSFTCKKGGKCRVTVQNRRRCQACRYKRCIRTGMTPSAVMTEQQVKTRFKNMFQRRDKRKESPTPSSPQNDQVCLAGEQGKET